MFGLVQRQRMQCLSRPNRPEQVKEARIFQVDLQYPPPKERPAGGSGCAGGTASTPASAASSPVVRLAAPPSAPPTLALGAASAPGSPDAAAKVAAVVTAAGDASSVAARPSFAELLQGSLKVQGEMRAWFDEEVRQPVPLPVCDGAPAGAHPWLAGARRAARCSARRALHLA